MCILFSHDSLFANYLNIFVKKAITNATFIVGSGDVGIKLANNMFNSPVHGLNMVGFYDDSMSGTVKTDQGVFDVLGNLNDLVNDAKSMDIDINSSEIGDARDNLNNDFSERRLVVFISESVPMPVLRAYARSLHKVDGVMVLRGMKGGMGKVAPTMRFVAEIIKTDALCKNKACPSYDVPIFIDPILYAQYAIKRVPAVTLIKNKSLQQHCDYQKEIVDVNKTVSLGDASLLTHLAYLESQFRKEDVKSFIYELEGRNEL